MFSGIVEARVRVLRVDKPSDGRCMRITIAIPESAGDVRVGESIAVNGVCLTVVDKEKNSVVFEVMHETLVRTNLAELKEGDLVNFERSLRVGDLVSGHFVMGHIDFVGIIESIENMPDGSMKVWIRIPRRYAKYIAQKGSIAVDGVSLTVVDSQNERFSISLIPHTQRLTTLGIKREGDKVNVEIDILARYVEKITADSLRKREVDT